MTTEFPDFPYQLGDEPTNDWTVEHVLQWWMLRAKDETENRYNDIVGKIEAEFEQGVQELWKCHNQVKNDMGAIAEEEPVVEDEDNENTNPQMETTMAAKSLMAGAGAGTKSNKLNKARTQTSTATSSTQGSRTKSTTSDAASTKSKSKSASTSSQSILVNIVGGEYTGSKFELKHLTHKNGGFVGRSTGKKFREKGISVPRDLEVSTTHGKFECKGGRYFYTDTGSTNGSCIGGEEIEPETPYELVDGMEVSIGQTIMLIAFPR